MKDRNKSADGNNHPALVEIRKKQDKAPGVGSRKFNNRPAAPGSFQVPPKKK